jgi:hypothetical protein
VAALLHRALGITRRERADVILRDIRPGHKSTLILGSFRAGIDRAARAAHRMRGSVCVQLNGARVGPYLKDNARQLNGGGRFCLRAS